MEFTRENYLQQLIDAQNNGFIKVITGLRKVGKTDLLKTLFKNYLLSYSIE